MSDADTTRELGPETLELVAERFKVLGESTRLRILDALREGEKTVGQLVEEVGSSQANVSKHLGILHRHQLVERRKEGVHSYYSISDPGIFQLCNLVCEGIEEGLDARREALDSSG